MYNMQDVEIWKDINGFEGCYQVSSMGKIRSLKREDPTLIRYFISNSGYKRVNLFNSTTKKYRKFSIHRLVANAFIKNDRNLPVIHHINDNKLDNNVSNLMWVTYKQNSDFMKLKVSGENNYNSKMTLCKIKYSFLLFNSGVKQADIARFFNISRSTINKIIKRKNWKHVDLKLND